MVGIFSRFYAGKTIHRRTQSALNEREVVLPPNAEATGAAIVSGAVPATAHGIEVSVEFKPVEHPTEPFDNDRPIQCPLPEPSILNDGRIWKERVSAGVPRNADVAVMQEGGTLVETGAASTKPPRPISNRLILPSISAPEHNILKLLEESGI